MTTADALKRALVALHALRRSGDSVGDDDLEAIRILDRLHDVEKKNRSPHPAAHLRGICGRDGDVEVSVNEEILRNASLTPAEKIWNLVRQSAIARLGADREPDEDDMLEEFQLLVVDSARRIAELEEAICDLKNEGFVHHDIGCPGWYRDLRDGKEYSSSKDPCDCGLDDLIAKGRPR